MTYIDGMVAAVPSGNKQAYLDHARTAAEIFREHGALRCVENWGTDIPEGKLTDFHRAVQAKDGEAIVLSWITWPSKEARDAGWEKIMQDERMASMSMPFDGKRMIYGGFDLLLEV